VKKTNWLKSFTEKKKGKWANRPRRSGGLLMAPDTVQPGVTLNRKGRKEEDLSSSLLVAGRIIVEGGGAQKESRKLRTKRNGHPQISNGVHAGKRFRDSRTRQKRRPGLSIRGAGGGVVRTGYGWPALKKAAGNEEKTKGKGKAKKGKKAAERLLQGLLRKRREKGKSRKEIKWDEWAQRAP